MDPAPSVKSHFSAFPDVEVKEPALLLLAQFPVFIPVMQEAPQMRTSSRAKRALLSASFHPLGGNPLQRSSHPPLQKLLCSTGEKWNVSSREIPVSRTAFWVKLTKKIPGRNKVEGELVRAAFWSGTKNSTRIRCSALILPSLNAWLLRLNVVLKLGLHEIDKHNYLALLQSIIWKVFCIHSSLG